MRAIVITVTTAERFRDVAAQPGATVSIAGVPWPTYKVASLLVGFVVFVVVGVVTGSAAPAVLAGSGVAALTWLALGSLRRAERR